jgi:cytochrome c-type biogenesis protein CcmH
VSLRYETSPLSARIGAGAIGRRTDRDPARMILLLVGLATIAIVALACTGDARSDVPELEQQAYSLNQAIMCPVCPGESIDQSQNPLAVQMRAIVLDKLTTGWSDQQIKDFFVERYGPSVLLAPPTEGISLAAWIVPPAAIVGAVIALLLALRWMRRSQEVARAGEGSALTAGERKEYFQRIEAALDLEEEADGAG